MILEDLDGIKVPGNGSYQIIPEYTLDDIQESNDLFINITNDNLLLSKDDTHNLSKTDSLDTLLPVSQDDLDIRIGDGILNIENYIEITRVERKVTNITEYENSDKLIKYRETDYIRTGNNVDSITVKLYRANVVYRTYEGTVTRTGNNVESIEWSIV